MFVLEEKEQKYSVAKHRERLQKIIKHWDEILSVIEEELPTSREIAALLDKIGAPKTAEEIGVSTQLLSTTFQVTKDIRDKYVLSRLAWDLGVLEELVV